MHLWTEYEGNTLAGYPLGPLYRSEGRSAFFVTTTAEGQPALLRLTEAHFDEAELIGRWQKIAEVSHPNLQTISHFGRTNFDEVPLACCLVEATDGSLADVLRERVLSVAETKEVAEAVGGALAALHAAGLVHEHVDATNVFAVGETVKLRSDCARECVGDFEADTPEARTALRQTDVRDLGLLLLRCLTVDWQGTVPMPLPSPFDRLVPKLLDGKLSAEELVTTLTPPPIRPRPVPAAQVVAAGAGVAPVPAVPVAGAAPSVPQIRGTGAVPSYAQAAGTSAAAAKPRAEDPFDVGLGSLRNVPPEASTIPGVVRGSQGLTPFKPRPISTKAWIASGAAAAMLALVLWNTVGGTKHTATESAAAASVPEKVAATAAPTQPVKRAKPSAIPEMRTSQSSLLSSGVTAGWHVIAYTYNYEQRAQAKPAQLKRKYVSLEPQVFTPTGHAPYFVALGGSSDAARAMALRNRARQVGLPRDTYARNF